MCVGWSAGCQQTRDEPLSLSPLSPPSPRTFSSATLAETPASSSTLSFSPPAVGLTTSLTLTMACVRACDAKRTPTTCCCLCTCARVPLAQTNTCNEDDRFLECAARLVCRARALLRSVPRKARSGQAVCAPIARALIAAPTRRRSDHRASPTRLLDRRDPSRPPQRAKRANALLPSRHAAAARALEQRRPTDRAQKQPPAQ